MSTNKIIIILIPFCWSLYIVILIWNSKYINVTNVVPEIAARIVLQKRPRSQICHNSGYWDGNQYRYYNQSQNCSQFIANLAQDTHITRWIFLGDSTMRYTYEGFIYQMNNRGNGCSLSKKCRNPCTFDNFLNLPHDPNITQTQTAFCQLKTRGCYSQGHICGKYVAEYIRVDYVKDVPIDKPNMTLYQKVNEYFNETFIGRNSICVLNAGLHEFRVIPITSTDLYVKNAFLFLRLLEKYCTFTFWITVSNTMELKQWPQNNKQIQEWNNALRHTFESQWLNASFLIDIYSMSSLRRLHVDNVHLNTDYYRTLGNYFLAGLK